MAQRRCHDYSFERVCELSSFLFFSLTGILSVIFIKASVRLSLTYHE
ncbi:hypothetical protein [Lactococcus protaetiae]|nr:hypothetical protein [Lactococcus protaetiae]